MLSTKVFVSSFFKSNLFELEFAFLNNLVSKLVANEIKNRCFCDCYRYYYYFFFFCPNYINLFINFVGP